MPQPLYLGDKALCTPHTVRLFEEENLFQPGFEPRFLSLVTRNTVTIVTELSWLQEYVYFTGSVGVLSRI
jgi:hypothetical protein